FKAARDGGEFSGAVRLRKWLGAPGRLAALRGRLDPDLEDPCLGRLQIVFGVADAAASAHHLHVARFGSALVAETVLMRDRALADIGDDFHVGVGVRRKAGVRRDLVFVPHPKRAVTHIFRVVMAAKREVVLGLQPAVVGGAQLCKWPEFDHGMFLCVSIFRLPATSMGSGYAVS